MWHDEVPGGPPPPGDEDAGGARKVSRRASPRPYTSFKWTEDLDRQLSELWFDNLTCSHIASRLGRTRNAIIGRAHRIGLPRRNGPASIEIARMRKVKRRQYLDEVPKPNRVPIAKAQPKPKIKIEQPAGLADPPIVERAESLLDVGVDCCKYPLDKGWCNRPRWYGSASYCRSHHSICNHKAREF